MKNYSVFVLTSRHNRQMIEDIIDNLSLSRMKIVSGTFVTSSDAENGFLINSFAFNEAQAEKNAMILFEALKRNSLCTEVELCKKIGNDRKIQLEFNANLQEKSLVYLLQKVHYMTKAWSDSFYFRTLDQKWQVIILLENSEYLDRDLEKMQRICSQAENLEISPCALCDNSAVENDENSSNS